MSLADSALSFARKAVEREAAGAKKEAKNKLRQTTEVLKDGLQIGGKSTFNPRNSRNVLDDPEALATLSLAEYQDLSGMSDATRTALKGFFQDTAKEQDTILRWTSKATRNSLSKITGDEWQKDLRETFKKGRSLLARYPRFGDCITLLLFYVVAGWA